MHISPDSLNKQQQQLKFKEGNFLIIFMSGVRNAVRNGLYSWWNMIIGLLQLPSISLLTPSSILTRSNYVAASERAYTCISMHGRMRERDGKERRRKNNICIIGWCQYRRHNENGINVSYQNVPMCLYIIFPRSRSTLLLFYGHESAQRAKAKEEKNWINLLIAFLLPPADSQPPSPKYMNQARERWVNGASYADSQSFNVKSQWETNATWMNINK